MATTSSTTAQAQITPNAASGTTTSKRDVSGGRFDFDDGGTYCGGWDDGKAHGHGVCTGPKGQGEYAGSWHYGFEVSGSYTWPSGSSFEGHWQNGKRHGLGVETRGRWLYRGEWTQGFKGRYGVRQASISNAKYEGTWANGLQDGYGSETYADTGTYQGQWLRGLRHGYGVRTSAPFGLASSNKLAENRMGNSVSSLQDSGVDGGPPSTIPEAGGSGASAVGSVTGGPRKTDEIRGGFVLRAKSDEQPSRRRSLVERTGMKTFVQGLKLKKQRSTGDITTKGVTSIRSTGSTTSWMSSESGYPTGAGSVVSQGSDASFAGEDEQLDASVTETYMGEWKNDKRSGFGISERSDGLKYEGEWFNNRKYGYGITTHRGQIEEGKYKNNVLVTSTNKRHMFLIRSAKFRERIDSALNAAQRASKIALQKADIAISRTATARGKAEQSDIASMHAREDAQIAKECSLEYGANTASPTSPNNESNDMSKMNLSPTKQQGSIQRLKTPEPANKTSNLSPTRRSPIPSTNSLGAGTANSNIHSPSKYNNESVTLNQSLPQKPSPSSQQLGGGSNLSAPAQSQTNARGAVGGQAQAASFSNQKSAPQMNSAANSSQPIQQFQQEPIGPQPTSQEQLQKQQQQAQKLAAYLNKIPKPSTSAAPQPRSPSPLVSPTQNGQDKSGIVSPNKSASLQTRQNNYSNRSMPQQGSCDIPDNNSFSRMPMTNERLNSASVPSYNVSNKATLQAAPQGMSGPPRGRSPAQQPFQSFAGGNAGNTMRGNAASAGMAEATGGYNFNRIMDDHFEHYKRPASRERSVDKLNMPNALSEAPSRVLNRPGSRARTPSLSSGLAGSKPSLSKTDIDLDKRLEALDDTKANGGLPNLQPGSGELTYRGPNQEIAHIGTIPKRTESMYFKPLIDEDSNTKDSSSGGAMKRKKSLPDVQDLAVVTKQQSSKQMTREEISVLSTQRRETMRRQMEEIERYKSNPLLYILNPRMKDWIYRQRLMLFILFLNLSLAIMFFKLLT